MADPVMAKLQRNWAGRGAVRGALGCAIGVLLGTVGCGASSGSSGGLGSMAPADGGSAASDASTGDPARERGDAESSFGGGGAASPRDAGSAPPGSLDAGIGGGGNAGGFGGLPAVPPPAEDGSEPSSGGLSGGGSTGGGADAGGAADAGSATPVTDVQSTSRPLSEPVAEASGGGSNRVTCYNGVDDDGTGGTDCNDRQCHALRSCCIDHGDCCSPVTPDPPLPASLDFGECLAGEATACFPDAVTGAFGAPRPWIDDRGLAPGGDAHFDSGLVVGSPVDLTTRRLVARAELHVPEACGTSCIDGAGLALTAQASFGDASYVQPIAGLRLAGSDNEMHLIVGGRVMASWDASEGSTHWSLRLRPNGELSVHRGDTELTEPGSRPTFAPRSGARLVIYGRTRNSPTRNAGGVRIGRVRTEVALCDMPSAWDARRRLEIRTAGGEPASLTPGPGAPSVSKVDGEWLAFASQGAIYVARRQAPAVFQLVSNEPVLTHPSGGTLDDPELVWVGPDTWRMYFTWADSPGDSVIGWVDASSPAELDATTGVETLEPGRELVTLEAPTVAKHPDAEVMVAKAETSDGSQKLVAYRRPAAGDRWQRILNGDLEALTDPGGTGRVVADADAIGSPSLMIANGAWNLYFTRRRGTSRAIVLLASDELVYWRAIDGGAPVLEGSGSGFDRAGVSDPDVRRTAGGVSLYYTGHDGVTTTLGRTTRDATSSGTLRDSANAI